MRIVEKCVFLKNKKLYEEKERFKAMIFAKIGKITSLLISLALIMLGGVIIVICAATGSGGLHLSEGGLEAVLDGIGWCIPYVLSVAGALALLIIITAVAKFVASKRGVKDISYRERLLLLELGFGFIGLDEKKLRAYKRSIKLRNAVDLIASELVTLTAAFIIDYLLLFADFDSENISSDIIGALTVTYGFALIGFVIWVGRWIYSECSSKRIMNMLGQGDFCATEAYKKKIEAVDKICRSPGFVRFKKRLLVQRIIRAVLTGMAVAMAVGAVALLLSKRDVVGYEPMISLYISIGIFIVAGFVTFLLARKSDTELAARLDREFNLSARVQTMVEYNGEEGDMLEMQRQDADEKLLAIPLSKFKFKRLWINIVAVALSMAMLGGSLMVENIRGYIPPEEVEAFSLTELQEASLRELISYVKSSALEEHYKAPMAEEIENLIAELKSVSTKPDMQIVLTKSMAVITNITYESSTETEMLNALWDSGEINFRHLARVLYSGDKSSADWGDFAEGLNEYIGILLGDNETDPGAAVGAARLKWAIDSMNTRLDMVLQASGLDKNDEMYIAVEGILKDETAGLNRLNSTIDYMKDDEARTILTNYFEKMSEPVFAAISLNRANAAVGEYAMTRLSALFGVPLPEFERPEFIKKNLAVDGSQITEDDDDKNGVHQGGLGEGATFGSDDYVLNPLTGEYVKVGELIHSYYALMFEKLEGDSYSEEMKTIIRKYFDLLYAGLDEEGK